MKLSLAMTLTIALAPVYAMAQGAEPPVAPDLAPTAQQTAAMQQFHAQIEAARQHGRAQILAALTPQHRTAVATIVGQLTLAPNPDALGAAQQLDALFSPSEKQSIVNIDAAQRSSMSALMAQHRAAFEATMPADARARMAQREAKMQAFMQSHPRPADATDPGAIVLRTLGNVGQAGKLGRPGF